MKTNVAVFFGGRSVEHEISVISALQAISAFDKNKYNVIPVYITKQGKWLTGDNLLEINNYKDLPQLEKESEEVYMRPEYGDMNLYRANLKSGLFSKKEPIVCELHAALPVLHGSHGEDGMFEGILESIGIPYAGCDTLSSANGMDKITMKMILRSNDIPVVDYVWFTDKQWSKDKDKLISEIEEKLSYPVIVKPANLGSSVGISKASHREELTRKVADAAKFSQRLIVEKMIQDMKEINCSVLGDCDDYKTSVCEEPVSKSDFLTYEEKYGAGSGAKAGMQNAEKRIPANIPETTSNEIRHLAGETFRVLSCQGVSRVDVMIDNNDGKIYVNEINTIPGSLSYYLWEETGLSFKKLIDELMALAFKRKRETDKKSFSYDTNIFAMRGGIKGGTKGMKLS